MWDDDAWPPGLLRKLMEATPENAALFQCLFERIETLREEIEQVRRETLRDPNYDPND